MNYGAVLPPSVMVIFCDCAQSSRGAFRRVEMEQGVQWVLWHLGCWEMGGREVGGEDGRGSGVEMGAWEG